MESSSTIMTIMINVLSSTTTRYILDINNINNEMIMNDERRMKNEEWRIDDMTFN